ncbi:ribose 5-phosphate isomerase B [Desulfurispirillum indicum]|uniref:Ribose 5-phosphate isomerase B n=1 Tax=Desulfurispirillum indicum (strain ATCC BAA-1389 / DSM 22839 / S5) TaxID=653733 RepID=E6W086_DESIS|nr:ribose 5-phosphate isomerase B [Desulfurispirillum indicum]ADU65212.1 ribose 5-phosphate isomerase B [Desulfurispirillum indicum S5]UCZ57102.1 ribose 5-phosphate isomerase B [Desulfurispirillum indicum]
MQIAFGCDHGGFMLKELILSVVRKNGLDILDFGCMNTERVDYPDYASPVCQAIRSGQAQRGILVCGSGIGMSIAANKFAGIRATLCNDLYTARFSRLHNDSNVLCLGGRIIGPDLAADIVQVWLDSEFEGGRHSGRLQKIRDLETASKAAPGC